MPYWIKTFWPHASLELRGDHFEGQPVPAWCIILSRY
jgi:hypothetical protein